MLLLSGLFAIGVLLISASSILNFQPLWIVPSQEGSEVAEIVQVHVELRFLPVAAFLQRGSLRNPHQAPPCHSD